MQYLEYSVCPNLFSSTVPGATGFHSLCQNLKVNKFSIIVDESTDITATKSLDIVVRYNENFTIREEFLGLVPVSDASAVNLYNVITQFFNDNDIPYKTNLIGFAADGANNVTGKNNYVMTILKKDVPTLFTMKCICHSLAFVLHMLARNYLLN